MVYSRPAIRRIAPSAALSLVCAIGVNDPAWADWPMLRGSASHDGYAEFEVQREYRCAWAVEFEGERLGTAVEPIVVGDRLYVPTHAGSLYALDAVSGEALWRFYCGEPILQSPAVAAGVLTFGDTAGRLFGVDAQTGKMKWVVPTGPAGVACAPVIDNGIVFVGTRTGDMLAVDAQTGNERWRQHLGAPVRQTAAVANNRLFVTTEELQATALEASTGKLIWRSKPLAGQSARDYYPVAIWTGNRLYVIFRTNPAHNFADRLGNDRRFLAQQAGVDDSHWQKLDTWLKSEAARGTPELWAREQDTLTRYIATNRLAQTFFVFDGESGRELDPPPVLWTGGCQGVGPPPARAADGRLVTLYRSAYGNWNLGVAPFVALGLLDLKSSRISPLFHSHGIQPPWNTFWGTADESQHLQVCKDTVLLVHQGTLGAFSLTHTNLVRIYGDRDSYGGFNNPPWARNEWHGPARGAVALSKDRIYWQTGSRVLCLVPGNATVPPPVRRIRGTQVKTIGCPALPIRSIASLRAELGGIISEFFSSRWAPLMVEPGLSGREFFFNETSSIFEALSYAYPHLEPDQQTAVRTFLAEEFSRRAPFTNARYLPLSEGRRREWVEPPPESVRMPGNDRPPHAFAGVYSAWLYGSRCGEMQRVIAKWPEIRDAYRSFVATGWKLDGVKGDLHANLYLRALLATADLAERAGDAATAQEALAQFETNVTELARWYHNAAAQGTLTGFRGVSELDRFIGNGDLFSFRIAPHRHKVALFHGLSFELARRLKALAGNSVLQVWDLFGRLHSTWWLTGEERQVHFGENYIDPPDLAASAFLAQAWLTGAPAEELARKVDMPFCKADLFHALKLGVALDPARAGGKDQTHTP